MLGLLLLGGLIIALELPGLLARGQRGELRTFWILLALGVTAGVSVLQKWPIPSPTRFLEAVLRPMAAMLGLQ